MLSFAFWSLYVLLLLCALILTLLILIQKGRGGGLSSAFGGGGGGSAAFGAKTGDVLTWATSILFGIFMILAVCLNLVANARQANMNAQAALTTSVQQPVSSAPSGK
jgi:preprotein translocase subunit SecG